MLSRSRWRVALPLAGLLALASAPAVAATLTPLAPPRAGGRGLAAEWAGFAANAQHTALARQRPQPFGRIRRRAKVDLAPDSQFGVLPIHYASPMITSANTCRSHTGGRQGRVPAGRLFRSQRLPALVTRHRLQAARVHRRLRHLDATVAGGADPDTAVAVAGAGGTVLVRKHADKPSDATRRLVFYGATRWRAHRAAYERAVQITTPLTAGRDGSLYFGFTVTGSTPAHISSGIARIDAHGHATWISAAAAAGNPAVDSVAMNCAPALSRSGKTVYITVTSPTRGILVGLDAATLRPRFHATLKDPISGRPAFISPSSSASPTVGPDGDVYYGVLENPFPNHDDRGWLLHFNATLSQVKTPGSFGWDNTVSVLPARAVPGYSGTSPYLLVSKYNNYLGIGPHGNGRNRVAVLDPRASQKDPYAPTEVMKAVQTVLSPTHEPGTPARARYEWCINSAAVDSADGSVIVNSEDGTLYRWDLPRTPWPRRCT